jgi:hypothetical protein
MSTHKAISNGSLSLVEETAVDTGDMIFTTEQVNEFSYQMLRNLASEARTNEINGKSQKLLIQQYYGRQRTLTEYE